MTASASESTAGSRPDDRTTPERREFTVATVGRIADVPAAEWDALAGTDHPFTRHAFLHALEHHGCVGERVGWLPCHVLVHADGRLVGATPAYVKLHSQGEFVFDWSWAEAYARHGIEYYPKLVSAIPFTPSTGPRLLVHPTAPAQTVKRALAAGAVEVAKAMDTSSFHWLFPREGDAAALGGSGLLIRSGCQFHWTNPGYRDFQDYLDALTSKRRKEIRRERRDAASAPVEIEIHDGRTATETHWRAYHALYSSTYDRKWGYPALTPGFFTSVAESLPAQTLVVLAKRGPHYVAGAHCFVGRDTLFGRNWGCAEHHRGLHFEICYYRLIEYCIRRGITRFDAGAQGEHKLMRGFLPVETCSAHWIRDTRFREAIGRFLANERAGLRRYRDAMEKHAPYRVTSGGACPTSPHTATGPTNPHATTGPTNTGSAGSPCGPGGPGTAHATNGPTNAGSATGPATPHAIDDA